MEVQIRHGKDKQSLALARGHHLVCDQPVAEGGSDTGMTPPELMLSAIGCCAMYYAAEYLRARHLAEDAVALRVTASKGGHPVRLVEIGIEVDAPGLSERAQEGVLKAIHACLLHRTLADPPRLKIVMASSEAAAPMTAPDEKLAS